MHRGALLGPGDCTWPWPPAVHYRRPQWEQPAEARTTTQGGMLSCASRASSIWLTALPIHNALTLSNSAFCNAFQFRLGLSPRPMHAPRVQCGCGALFLSPGRPPPQAHLSPTSLSTLKSAPSSPLQGLRATIFSVELGARSCNLLGRPPYLSPTARDSRDPTQPPKMVTGRTSSVSSRTAFCAPMCP